ncbi:hypothetical protein FOZ61_008748 [Perkinsus olseni]|uniref:RING-type domain-containing protein n=1 Tax=Perkinsus olseni TaxID=32597 RepID=A0A7J6L425_PEROL|nr:hypothetical protein FOZ61_008748 [Perkinsus olseni]KAF4669457.1 hypothetical protein FOL46_001454 [Perkinsus olseni]
MEPYPLSMVSHLNLTSRSQRLSARDRRYRIFCVLLVLTTVWFFVLGTLVGITIYANTGSASFSFPVYVVIIWAVAPPLLLQFWRRRSNVLRMGAIKRRTPRSLMPQFDTLFKPATPSKGELCPICLGDMSDSAVSKNDDGKSTKAESDSVGSDEKPAVGVLESNVVESVYCSHKFDRDCAKIYTDHWGPTAVGAKGDVVRCPVCRASWAPGIKPDEEVGCDDNSSLYYYASSTEGTRDSDIASRV